MPEFGKRSAEKLATCHHDLQVLMDFVVMNYDITVMCGHRGKAEQDAAVASGNSKTKWPNSKHNSEVSRAVDVAPFAGIVMLGHTAQEMAEIYFMAGRIMASALFLGLDIRWGGDWDHDGHTYDNKFNDLFHFEIR